MKERAIKWYESLHHAKGRKKEGYCLVEGVRAVEQLIAADATMIDEILYTEGYSLSNSHIEGVTYRLVSESQMQKIGTTVTASVVIAVLRIDSAYRSDTLPLPLASKILFLEDVQDPGNMGTLIRSAVAFGFGGIILTSGCADPYAPKVLRSTGGAMSALWIRRPSNPYQLLEELQRKGVVLITADLGGESTLPSEKMILVALGNEGNGVSEKLHAMSDRIYTIPYEDQKIESLNVSVAGSVVMAQLYCK